MDNGNLINVNFTHPRSAKLFAAEISPQCTGQKAIDGLMIGNEEGPFLDQLQDGNVYKLVLKKTQGEIPLSLTFADAGIGNGDVIEVRLSASGA